MHPREIAVFLQVLVIGDGAVLAEPRFGLAERGVNGRERLKAHPSGHRFVFLGYARSQDTAQMVERIQALPVQNTRVRPVERKAVAILVNKLRAVGVLFGVGIPHLNRVLHGWQHFLVEGVVGRVIEQTEFGVKGVGDDEQPAFSDQRVFVIGVEQPG